MQLKKGFHNKLYVIQKLIVPSSSMVNLLHELKGQTENVKPYTWTEKKWVKFATS